MSKMVKLLFAVCLFALATVTLNAQGIFATLTGVVSDPSESIVPNAKVTLRDIGSGSVRETATNGQGYFTFASVPVGTYSLTVEAQGFKTHKEDAIRLGGGEQRNVNVALAVGGSTETIEVTGVQDFTTAPVDTGEKSFTLESKELQNFTQVGSNAAEYIKIVPGFGINNGTSNRSSYRGTVVGINANGDGGDSQSPLNNNYSYNGLPTNSLDITLDGAHVSDPGCNCDTPVNPNSDFLQEFKVLTSNFSAEEQKGPIVITSVTKSGGNSYHGSGFFSARNHVLNANDWLNNNQTPIVKQPANSYYYPGGTFSGPVPKLRDKVFFWTGFEYFHQTLDTGLIRATVPTAGELAGDFSDAEVDKEGVAISGSVPPHHLNAAGIAAFGGHTAQVCTGTPDGTCIDPNMLALAKLFPAPNATATTQNPYNFAAAQIFNQNNRQWAIRGDYNISDSTKVFVRYNYQREVQLFPVGLWWRNGDQVPYPTAIQGKNKSDSWTGTITHVFSPTMTNETVMAYTFVGFPNVFADPNKVDRATVGYGYAGLFGNGVSQIPSFGNFGPSEAALVFNPGGFEAGGPSQGLYANKWMPSVSDTLTKVIGTHTLKGGFFYEWIRNAQPANNNTNGQLLVSTNNTFSYGNEYADLLTGNLNSYTETNFNRLNDISYNTYEFFGQDSWKVTRKLTVEYGMRFTHFTPWIDDENFGYSIFNPSLYDPANNGACAAAPTFCGFAWHAKDQSVPIGGFPTRALFYQPRLGAAYDLFGNGNTVLRGGWGRFYYHSGQFTNGLDASAGVATASIGPSSWVSSGGGACPVRQATDPAAPLFASYLSCLNVSATPASPAAVDSRDDKQPYTDSWSFTVSQRAPWQSRVEVAYVGNRSRDLANSGGFGSNRNLVPAGAITAVCNQSTDCDSANANANSFRPLQGYGDLNQATNNAYSNYNALQITWGRHVGRYTMQANYTLQKSLGIVLNNANNQSNGSISIDPFNLRANYGVQPTDRRHLFNYAYSIDLGNPMHAHGVLEGITGGWQVSGVLQLQSGANLTYGGGYNSSTNFHMSLTCKDSTVVCPQSAAIIPGTATGINGDPLKNGIAINNQSILGTNALQLNPIVTCNPSSGLSSHQFVNPNCFAAPTVVGQNGPTLLPVSYGPAYFNWDTAIFKNFKISESKSLQFRVNGYNFLNHPLWSFPDAGNLTLQFVQDPATGVITQQNPNFGKTTVKQGARIVEFAVKFYF
jgi:Carboxypeptidase regulatory-like domain